MGSRAIKHRPGTRNKRRFVVVLYILAVIFALGVIGCCSLYSMGQSWLQDLPDYQDASSYNLAQKTSVYADDGHTLLAEFYLENREPVSDLDSISSYVVHGTVATEDERFYEHGGIDLTGIARAIAVNLTGGSKEGASTITQQFVRNTVLADEASEQTIKRKVREAYISLKLEGMYSKDDILLMYLNTINYGQGAYGIEAASKEYFSKDCKDLTLSEAATLVGIPQSPTNNNPIDNPDACLSRRNVVLNRMLSNGYISQSDYDNAVAQPLGLNVSTNSSTDGIYKYPYFTSYVRDVLLDNYSESEVFKGGLKVTTSLNVDAQEAAENAAAAKEASVDSDLEVAMVAVDPSTGFIKALVGGKDYYEDEYNLATQATRQPGSSFKTFTLASAIENGIDPTSTYVNCSSTAQLGNWSVENYDKTSYGTRTISGAFAVSSNTAFARLVTLLGPDKVVEEAQKMGIQTSLESVPSITLGSQGVTVREMAGAYGTIASGGIQHDAIPIEKIEDANGKVIYQPDTSGKRVLSSEVANATENVMEGVITNGTGTAARLSNGQTAAGKTGTSEEWRDSWFCGITPQYSVAIWLGCRQERTMSSAYSATSVFSSFLNQLLAGQSLQAFPMAGAQKPTYRTLTSSELSTLGGGTSSSSSSSSTSNSSSSSSSSTSSSSTYSNNSSGNWYSNSSADQGDSTDNSSSTSTSGTDSGSTTDNSSSTNTNSSTTTGGGGSSGTTGGTSGGTSTGGGTSAGGGSSGSTT
ncbi:MAG: penicillin-binding protein [Eggerthellaceae bacterium]|jgi:penicillin-binding protein 1A|nr:penicillin-binding protein [Eggerthellaceae bacterium]MCH4221498.1 penicillin-binding protein [Eggerthellaceae bacterium]